MYEFKCVLWYVVLGVKYQAKGYSRTSLGDADRDAFVKLVALMTENDVPADAAFTRGGREYYRWGKPTCEKMWWNAQARSPWANAWI